MNKNILVTGGTGLIGTELCDLLRKQGNQVRILSRKKREHPHYQYFKWDISEGYIEEGALDVDYVIHLAGAGIADSRWTEKRKKLIIDSRVESTRLLAKAIKASGRKPGYVGASAIGIYGNQDEYALGEEEVSQDRSNFLVDVTHRWENAHNEVKDVVGQWAVLRIGIVLSKNGGALKPMLVPFMFRMANYFGNGSQVFSWIHIRDLCRIFSFIVDEELSSIYNGVAPSAVNGRELVTAIAKEKGGPFLKFGAPEFALKLALGEMSQAVLASTWVSAEKTKAAGFEFDYEQVDAAMEDLLG